MSKKLIVKLLAAVEEANRRGVINEIDLGVELPMLPRVMENAALAGGKRLTGDQLIAEAVKLRQEKERSTERPLERPRGKYYPV